MTVVTCCENEVLELQSACLYYTLRHHGGRLAGVPVLVYSPRPGKTISAAASRFFAELDVRHMPETLNQELPDYDMANKPYALLHAARTGRPEVLLWLDSDMLVWKEPAALELAPDIDVAAAAESCKNVGSSGPDDPDDGYWRALFTVCGTAEERYVTTSVDRQRIRAYYNGGLLAVRPDSGYLERWRRNIVTMVKRRIFPRPGRRLVEQTALAATAHSAGVRFKELPVTHNYFIQNHGQFAAWGGPAPHEACIWHYQCFFGRAFARFGRQVCKHGFDPHLVGDFVEDLRQNYARRLGRDEAWHKALRRKWQVGVRLRRFLRRPRPTDALLDN